MSASARSQPSVSYRSKEVRSSPGATGRLVRAVSSPPAGSTPVVGAAVGRRASVTAEAG
ncbi:hypothetical protein MRQ36_07490 [Micromonospora sp. R77]|uniref:hypothetical protein n=1 Tax=Micromonospora sp. R77 TaxID=2925836 RepID=UPI001F613E2A|nr:hypothetical protein [Micromonospora sp. R77]MCI4062414.1 hypothetical protein [Micromonospora sp. R77]